MDGLQRYVTAYERVEDGGAFGPSVKTMVLPDNNGDLVLFADVEEALRDSKRLAWLRPIIEGVSTPAIDRRLLALGAALSLGHRGNALVDYAMEGCPE